MNLNALQDFIDITARGGFGAASRHTGIPKATLSRRIRQLEDTLGMRLFERASTGFRLTDEGAMLYERMAPLLQEITDVKNDILHLRNTGASGRLRISVPTIIAHYITGRLAEVYHARYPNIELDIVADDNRVNLIKEGYDAVIRVDPDVNDDMVGKVLFTSKLYLVSAPHAVISGDELPFIDSEHGHIPSCLHVTRSGEDKIYKLRTVMRFSSPQMHREAAISGVGAALLPGFFISGDILSGKLTIIGVSNLPDIVFWFLYPSRRYVTPRLRNFLTILHDLFSQDKLINNPLCCEAKHVEISEASLSQ
ncbi:MULTISPECIES: LysR family transcriptional regulator [unclassified Brenneria]|uniref:LysR family transcriptional regulator n=1 Tax=unclassified Brenneria TaxID=2634434 RepID=UPI0015557CC3|nr:MULTISPECIES: LysR family transcriptional regulator [unclassified Brenneria]MBJ7220340.1 LysR family transcriptional regulator [Brenneria sp. L3-3C-1]MEE3641585.1 LysR family transcriptional regulator [Brenneria sp. L3_3C_1]MEE3649784.1 LysR family transcriptional regulator [Brenneria sp. HEZEL_4_2_4]NPC99743.1 LysR family transcriptional regulator [Brenneria sp. hezel4-2-4]